jgi:hypothetical protein
MLSRKRELESQGKGGKKKGSTTPTNQNKIAMFKRMAKEAIAEGASDRLTEQENSFAELVASGASLVEAYKQSFPELCYAVQIIDDREQVVEVMSYERMYSRANALAKKPDVRSSIITRLDQEEGDVSHTASRLDNFIVKRLEAEAADPNNSAAARIAALKALSEHRAVAVAEGKAAERAAATSEEVMEQIKERVSQLSGGKNSL